MLRGERDWQAVVEVLQSARLVTGVRVLESRQSLLCRGDQLFRLGSAEGVGVETLEYPVFEYLVKASVLEDLADVDRVSESAPFVSAGRQIGKSYELEEHHAEREDVGLLQCWRDSLVVVDDFERHVFVVALVDAEVQGSVEVGHNAEVCEEIPTPLLRGERLELRTRKRARDFGRGGRSSTFCWSSGVGAVSSDEDVVWVRERVRGLMSMCT